MGLGELWRRLSFLFRSGRFDRELDEEMRLHVELRARKLGAQGFSSKEARQAAERQFGNRPLIKEDSAELWGWGWCERLLQDLRYALRTLRKTPVFTVAAVLTLALGLGLNTAVFSLVNGVMIRSLPYPDAQQLVSLWEGLKRSGPGAEPNVYHTSGTGARNLAASAANLADWQRSQAFSGLAGYASSPMNLTSSGMPERIMGESVTANFFSVLGVQPARGRAFLPEEDRPGGNAVVIVTHEFCARRIGDDASALGCILKLDGRDYQVVGVLPPRFQSPRQLTFPDRVEFFVPAAYEPKLLSSRGDHEIAVVGRLKPGVAIQTAQTELDTISASLEKQFPDTNADLRAVISPLQSDIVRNVKDALWALLGAAGLIVLITCVNVANLFLVRAVARRHETSIRLALGAGRLRVVRHCLCQSMMVAAAGCGAGIALGSAMTRLLLRIAPSSIPCLAGVTMDWRVFGVAAALASVTGVVFGMVPAWQALRTKPAEVLKSTAGRSTGDRSPVRWRAVFTTAEIALSMVLLVGAGLLLRSFIRLMGVELGFETDHVLAMNVNLPELRYKSAQQRWQFFQQLGDRVKALPGVQSVAFANRMPLRGGWTTGVNLDLPGRPAGITDCQAVNPGYFQTLGIPLLRGRLLTAGDVEGQPYVAVVNREFARKLLPGTDALGRRFQRGSSAPWVTIVGVVNDIRRGGKDKNVDPQAYLPAAQTALYPVRLADFAVRSAGEPRRMLNAIQSQVWSLDKDQPVTNVRTLDEIISESAAERRFQTLLLVVFAALAVVLAVIGVFGVLSYAVTQRIPELGLRIALGAPPGNIRWLVARQAGWLVLAGIAIGLAGAFAASRYLQSMLFGIQPHDWRTYAGAALLLAGAGFVAALIPARRGAHTDPIIALRYE